MEYLGTTPRRYAGPVICFVGDCPSRDEPDYNLLMLNRMKILNQHGLKLHDIQQVISQICHMLVMDETNRITGYTLRQPDPRRNTVEALQGLKYQVIAMGDPYNDISILQQADVGILFLLRKM